MARTDDDDDDDEDEDERITLSESARASSDTPKNPRLSTFHLYRCAIGIDPHARTSSPSHTGPSSFPSLARSLARRACTSLPRASFSRPLFHFFHKTRFFATSIADQSLLPAAYPEYARPASLNSVRLTDIALGHRGFGRCSRKEQRCKVANSIGVREIEKSTSSARYNLCVKCKAHVESGGSGDTPVNRCRIAGKD